VVQRVGFLDLPVQGIVAERGRIPHLPVFDFATPTTPPPTVWRGGASGTKRRICKNVIETARTPTRGGKARAQRDALPPRGVSVRLSKTQFRQGRSGHGKSAIDTTQCGIAQSGGGLLPAVNETQPAPCSVSEKQRRLPGTAVWGIGESGLDILSCRHQTCADHSAQQLITVF
jgi:hypothetical protein